MDNASIITETPQRKGLSLKWKWALGSAAGVFLIFIIFAWFVVQAFSSQMLKTERQQVATSLQVVTTRLQNLDEKKLSPADVDAMLRPKSNDLNKVVNDPVMQQITRQDYTVMVYNTNGRQVYPIGGAGVPFQRVSDLSVKTERVNGSSVLVGRQELRNSNNHLIGYVVIENHLTSYQDRKSVV